MFRNLIEQHVSESEDSQGNGNNSHKDHPLRSESGDSDQDQSLAQIPFWKYKKWRILMLIGSIIIIGTITLGLLLTSPSARKEVDETTIPSL